MGTRRHERGKMAWKLRQLLLHGLPEETSLHGGAVDPRCVYLPAAHMKALRPETMVVVGMRGAGKSFWWSALQDQRVRSLIARLDPHADTEKAVVFLGFGERPEPGSYPDRDTLGKLLRENMDPRVIWRTVVAQKVAPRGHVLRDLGRWEDRVRWVHAHPEEVAQMLGEEDRRREKEKQWLLVLFDALDRSASEWHDMYGLIRGLLEAVLELRPYRRLRAKCFLRSDQLDERRVADFPDASKVLSSIVELSWTKTDLYGLLWHYLGNASYEAADDFRRFSEKRCELTWERLEIGGAAIWRVSSYGQDVEKAQRILFHELAGEWMGRDRRRGFPYTWIPGHLADGSGRVSPRSFLAALRAAAEDTEKRYGEYRRALHYESIKRGVQVASRIRVTELREDYPWVDLLMEPLRGLVVPCRFDDVVERWKKERVLERVSERVEAEEERLPPAHLSEGFEGVRRDLEELGIFVRMNDGRVNIPDVFRVGYGLGRKGGVRPVGKAQ